MSSISTIRFLDEIGEVEYFGKPIVILTRDAIKLMRDELIRISGASGRVIVHTAGHVSGREEGKALLDRATVAGVKSPQSLPSAILTAVEETNMGYGKIRIDDINLGASIFRISLSNSFEVDQSIRSRTPTCLFMLSYLKGLFSQLIGKDLGGVEIECRSKGDAFCRFRLSIAGQTDTPKGLTK